MKKYLLINTTSEYKYCFFQYDEQDINNTFIVEFALGANSYDRLYWWGRYEDQPIIKRFSTLSCVSDKEWQMIEDKEPNRSNIENYEKIVKRASREVEALKKGLKKQM